MLAAPQKDVLLNRKVSAKVQCNAPSAADDIRQLLTEVAPRQLTINTFGVKEAGFKALTDALQGNPTLEKITFLGVGIDGKAINDLCTNLQSSAVTTIEAGHIVYTVDHEKPQEESPPPIPPRIKTSPLLNKVAQRLKNGGRPERTKLPGQQWSQPPSPLGVKKEQPNNSPTSLSDQVKDIILEDYFLGTDKVKALLAEEQPTSISIEHTPQISSGGAGALARALEGNESVTHISLKGCHIGDLGAKAIAELPNTTTLNLAKNSIENKGMKNIINALKDHTALTSLDLSQNKINDIGARALADMLEHGDNTTLTTLKLENQKTKHNEIKPETLARIETALQKNAALAVAGPMVKRILSQSAVEASRTI